MNAPSSRSLRPLVLGLACAFSVFITPANGGGPPVAPLTLTLDMPSQTADAPSSGVNTVVFTGTVVVDPNWQMQSASIDAAYNVTKTIFLSGMFSSAFQAFVLGASSGTYTGVIFTIDVPAGTPVGFYGVPFQGHGPTLLKVQASTPTMTTFIASAPFSIQVTGAAVAAPEGGSTLLLLGVAASAITGLKAARGRNGAS